jgi:hypothetical protein
MCATQAKKAFEEWQGGDKSAPMTCQLTSSLRQTKTCNSEEEFDAFVAGYMGMNEETMAALLLRERFKD